MRTSMRLEVLVVSLALPGIATASPRKAANHEDCRYAPRAADSVDREDWRGIVLPARGLFRPLLADMKEPRTYASWRRSSFDEPGWPAGGGETFNAGLIAVGGSAGAWSWRRGCDGIQIGAFGAVFSQFNLDRPSQDLINTDYLAGAPITARWGAASARLRLYHQSSHLGDEFLRSNPAFPQVQVAFEVLDALVSLSPSWWRLYAGGGAIVHTTTELERGRLQGGIEARGLFRSWRGGAVSSRGVVGVDVRALEMSRWGVTTSIKAGASIAGPNDRRVRFLVAYLHGHTPFGQFARTETMSNVGLELHVDF